MLQVQNLMTDYSGGSVDLLITISCLPLFLALQLCDHYVSHLDHAICFTTNRKARIAISISESSQIHSISALAHLLNVPTDLLKRCLDL